MDVDALIEILSTAAMWLGRSWLRFAIVCGGSFLLFWVVFARRFPHRRCQPGDVERSMHWREFRNSMLGVIFFLTPMTLAAPLVMGGYTQLELDPTATPWWLLIIQFIVVVVAADTWFYFTHRLMHHSRIYAWTHKLHHLADNPSPLSGYAFSWAEGIVLGAFLPLLLLVMPVNVIVLAVFVNLFSLGEAYVHLGYEILPRWLARNPVGKLIGTSVMHSMHHEDGAYNFGVYFTWWDRALGTLHPDYTERYEAVTAQPLFARTRALEQAE